MAKNYLTRFATSPNANVLTDTELASQPEIASGFIPKSKASSKLIGKLIQNATAGSAAVGDYIAKQTQQDVSASDADLGTKLTNAIAAHIKAEAPKQDLSSYATKLEVTEGLAGKANITDLEADYVQVWTSANQSIMSENGTKSAKIFLKGESYTCQLKAAGSDGASQLTFIGSDDPKSTPSITFSAFKETDSTNYANFKCLPDEATLAYYKNNSAYSWISVNKENGISFCEGDLHIALKQLALKNDYLPITGGDITGPVTVQAPTDPMHPATKKYVDAAVSAVYKYKGSVKDEATLPKDSQVTGDVWNVEDTGMNVAWDGAKWDKLGSVVDLSGYATTVNVNAELAKKAPLANPTFTGTVTGTFKGNVTGNATSATKATQDSAGQAINTTYIKGLSVSGKVITFTRGDNTTGTITTQDTNTTYNNMTAATADAAGKAGLVPAPGAGAQTKYLRGDGTWQTVTTTDNKVLQTVSTTAGEFALLAKDQTAVTTTTRGSVFAAGVTVNPSTKTVTATTFKGTLSGNATTASTASKTKAALTLQLNGGSAQTFDGSTARTFNVTAASIGALPTSGGTVSGPLTVNGALKGATITATSDARLKNIHNRHTTLSNIYQLSAVDFSFRGSDDSTHTGLIAQELQALYPSLVKEDDRGYLSIDYCGVTALLVNDMKHLLGKINKLESQLEALKRDI